MAINKGIFQYGWQALPARVFRLSVNIGRRHADPKTTPHTRVTVFGKILLLAVLPIILSFSLVAGVSAEIKQTRSIEGITEYRLDNGLGSAFP